jgi:hypothetical protein
VLKKTLYPVTLLVILLFAFLLSEKTLSPVFQGCVNQQVQNSRADSAYNNPAIAYVRCSGVFIDRHGNGITALATIVIAAFTLTLWVASTRQAELTQEALIFDKRAAIFPLTFDQHFYRNTETNFYEWRLRPLWRNIGSTPALHTIQYSACEIRNTVLPDGFDFAYNPNDVGQGYFPPQTELFGGYSPKQTQAPITPHDIVDSQNGRKFIYLWGWISFSSIFPNTPRYKSHFCWVITVVGDPFQFAPNTQGAPPTPGALRFFLAQHKEGNTLTEEWD